MKFIVGSGMQRIAAVVVIGWLLLASAALAAAEAGLRYNDSPSVPVGLYWITNATPSRGDYVAVCPPPTAVFMEAFDRGYLGVGRCEGGYSELIKVLAAEAGDSVSLGVEGVAINGKPWPASERKAVDRHGRPMPVLDVQRELAVGEVLVMSEYCSGGFDGRYFGALPQGSVRGAARALLTW